MKRSDLIKLFQPYADHLAAELAQLAAQHIDGLIERARAYAIDKLRAELEGKTDAEEEDGHGDRDGAGAAVSNRKLRRNARKSRAVADRAVRARAASGKKERVCSKCQQPGHNARSCGREEEDEGRPATPEVKPARDRFAEIEARAQARKAAQA